jgi:hypothetical protein
VQAQARLAKLATSWATEIGRRSSETRLGKGNTKSVATKIVTAYNGTGFQDC